MVNYIDTGLPVIGLGDFISQEQANAVVQNSPDGITEYTVFGKAPIERLLIGDQVQGLRIYIAQEDGALNVVLVPVDQDGNDLVNMFDINQLPTKLTIKNKPTAMVARILNRGMPCPPKCIGSIPL